MEKIFIVGIGPGAKEYLLPVALRRITEADCLIGARRALDLFPEFKKEKVCFDSRLNRVIPYLKKYRKDKKIAVLVSGDPGLYSLAQAIARNFPKDEYEVIPGISSLQLAFAQIGESWQDVKIISLHGRKINPENLGAKESIKRTENRQKVIAEGDFLADIKNNPKVFIFTDNDFPPNTLASFLLGKGIKNRRAVVLENLSYPEERIVDSDLKKLSRMKGFSLCVMIIL